MSAVFRIGFFGTAMTRAETAKDSILPSHPADFPRRITSTCWWTSKLKLDFGLGILSSIFEATVTKQYSHWRHCPITDVSILPWDHLAVVGDHGEDPSKAQERWCEVLTGTLVPTASEDLATTWQFRSSWDSSCLVGIEVQ